MHRNNTLCLLISPCLSDRNKLHGTRAAIIKGVRKTAEQLRHLLESNSIVDGAPLLARIKDPGTRQNRKVSGNDRKIYGATLRYLAYRTGTPALRKTGEEGVPCWITQCPEQLNCEEFIQLTEETRSDSRRLRQFACLHHDANICLHPPPVNPSPNHRLCIGTPRRGRLRHAIPGLSMKLLSPNNNPEKLL